MSLLKRRRQLMEGVLLWALMTTLVGAQESGKFFVCKKDGKTILSDIECDKQGAVQNRIIEHKPVQTVPLASNNQIKRAEISARDDFLNRESAYKAKASPAGQPSVSGAAPAACNGVKQAIDSIDAATRQPLSGQMQDYYRQERKRYMDIVWTHNCSLL